MIFAFRPFVCLLACFNFGFWMRVFFTLTYVYTKVQDPGLDKKFTTFLLSCFKFEAKKAINCFLQFFSSQLSLQENGLQSTCAQLGYSTTVKYGSISHHFTKCSDLTSVCNQLLWKELKRCVIVSLNYQHIFKTNYISWRNCALKGTICLFLRAFYLSCRVGVRFQVQTEINIAQTFEHM